MTAMRSPIRVNGDVLKSTKPAPKIGQHNAEIDCEFDLTTLNDQSITKEELMRLLNKLSTVLLAGATAVTMFAGAASAVNSTVTH